MSVLLKNCMASTKHQKISLWITLDNTLMSNMYTAPFDKIYAQMIKCLACIKVHELKPQDQYKMKGNKYPNPKI